MAALHLRATRLPEGDEDVDLWVLDGRITFSPRDGAEELAPAGAFVLPGLVDAHSHPSSDFSGRRRAPGASELVGPTFETTSAPASC